jgi:Zn-dependent protease
MNLVSILIQVPVVLFCITIHEFSHGYAAWMLGDDTAKRAGRLTLNPLKHLDPIGAIMLLIAKIGWAKPVPVNPHNFRDMKTGMAIVGAAGPASNFACAIAVAILYRLSGYVLSSPDILSHLIVMFVMINIALGLFNLIPIPPLDGSRIIGAFMPDQMYFRWMQFERRGAMLLMIIFMANFIFNLNIIGRVIFPPLIYLTILLLGIPLDLLIELLTY